MDISFTKKSFRGIKLFVATPMYEGMCTCNYLNGMIDLFANCTGYEIPAFFYGTENQSLIQRARNESVAAFLETDCTHLLFIDADIGFSGKDALSLLFLAASDKEKQYDVLAGPYPKKTFFWNGVKTAVEKRLGSEDPQSLKHFGMEYAFLMSEQQPFYLKKPMEVLKAGTGFMLIPRRVFTKFKEVYPKQLYSGRKSREECAFFDCIIDPVTKHYWAEDYMFCSYVRKMGGKVWIAPWLELSHQGSHTFEGSLSHFAANANR